MFSGRAYLQGGSQDFGEEGGEALERFGNDFKWFLMVLEGLGRFGKVWEGLGRFRRRA